MRLVNMLKRHPLANTPTEVTVPAHVTDVCAGGRRVRCSFGELPGTGKSIIVDVLNYTRGKGNRAGTITVRAKHAKRVLSHSPYTAKTQGTAVKYLTSPGANRGPLVLQ